MGPDARRTAPPLTPEQMAAATTVTPEDVARAHATAELDGSPLFVAMLDASPGVDRG
jgi:hypothetical protein